MRAMPLVHDLAIAIRCHRWPHLVLDTVDAVFHYARTWPLVIIACDNAPTIPRYVQARYPQVLAHVSGQQWGWGPGLYGLMCETIRFAQQHATFKHFLTIDYDTIPIGTGFDEILLRIAQMPRIGLAGSHIPNSLNWAAKYQVAAPRIKAMMDGAGVRWPISTYNPGESCLGGMMELTEPCIAEMGRLGFFEAPFRDIRGRIALVDDPWTGLLVRAAGFDIYDTKHVEPAFAHIAHKSAGDWRRYPAQGMKIFNLGSVSRGENKQPEIQARNFFRQIRRTKLLGAEAARAS